LTGAPEPPPASDVRMSPNGRQALALVNNQLYLIDVPITGGEAPTININSPSVPIKKLTDVGADSCGWADDGKTITWALGASFFRQPVSTVTFDPEKKPTDETGEKKDEEPAPAKPAPVDKTPK